MSKTLKIILGIVVLVIIIILIVTFYKPTPKGTVKIGVLTALTGNMAEYGNNIKNGIELAVEEINGGGGINGRQIALFYEDSKCEPMEAVNGFSKLADTQMLNIVLGTLCSGETLAIAPIANEKKILVISAGASSPEITEAGDYIFRVYPSDDYEAGVAADIIFNKLNRSEVSIIYLNNDYGIALRDVFKKKFVAMGGKILNEESYLQNSKDFRTQLTKIKEKNPQLIYIIGYPIEGGLLIRQIKELGINTLIFGSSGLKANDFINKGGGAAEGMILAAPSEVSSGKRQEFVKNYERKFYLNPGLASDMAYDSVYILKEALTNTKNIEEIKNNLYKIKEFEGASGKFGFDSNGDRVGLEYDLLIIKNGQFVPLENY